MTMKASEILAHARDEVANGWCQGRGMDADGNVCMVGALTIAESFAREHGTHAHDLTVYPYWALMDTIQEQYGLTFTTVPLFNDHKNTKHQDVLNIFDKTIAGLEEKGL